MSETRQTLGGRVALVTGGGRRVGRAICQALADAGCDVGVHCRTSIQEAEQLAAQIRAAGRRAAVVRADLAEPVSWAGVVGETADALGRLDILVHNAAVFPDLGADDLASFDIARWDGVLRVNLSAVAGLTHHAAPLLVSGGHGRIITLCDIASDRPWPSRLAYSVSKAGLVALTRGLARAMAPDVLVNGVAPGIAEFPQGTPTDEQKRLVSRIPLGRAGRPADIAAACRFLAESEFITGQILTVDGGRSLA